MSREEIYVRRRRAALYTASMLLAFGLGIDKALGIMSGVPWFNGQNLASIALFLYAVWGFESLHLTAPAHREGERHVSA